MKYNFLMILFLANLHADYIVNTTNDLELVNLDPAKDFFYKKDYVNAYTHFNNLFLNNLENPEINYYLAKSAIKLEKYGLANAAFDRILINDPTNHIIRFEQAKLFYIVKNKEMAIYNIKELLEENISDNLRKEINSYLDIIKNNEKSYTLEAVFLLSLNRTDNANNAPNSKYILPDFTYLGEQGDSKVMDTYHTQLVNLTLTNRFENYDFFRIKNSITYFNRTFMNEKTENFELYSYKPSFQIVNKNSLFFMGPSFDRYQPGNTNSQDYFDAVGLEMGYFFDRYAFDSSAYRFFYRDDSFDDKNYTKYQGRFRTFDILGFDYSLKFYKDLAFTSERADIDKISLENILSYDINIQNDLSVEPSFKYKLTNYDDESFAFNSRRKDSLKEYKIELQKDLKTFGLLSLYVSYEDNDSNHAEYDSNTRNIGLTYIKGFKW